jgi:hypothetical protein
MQPQLALSVPKGRKPGETYSSPETSPGGAKENCDTNPIGAIRPANFPEGWRPT